MKILKQLRSWCVVQTGSNGACRSGFILRTREYRGKRRDNKEQSFFRLKLGDVFPKHKNSKVELIAVHDPDHVREFPDYPGFYPWLRYEIEVIHTNGHKNTV